MTRRAAPTWLIALAALAVLPFSVAAQPVPQAEKTPGARSEPVPVPTGVPLFPLGSRLGLIPPPGISPSQAFPGFEDRDNNVYIRLVIMPDNAFAEIEK